ncbi:hypothetical protein [Nocardioides rubriscoriae]|uniref:hypothetical protein n=1 Tax=Nocardioides rubriscoriae TaxID=642762 RepID=UPI0011DFD5BE|nr:hypothetical protein [Nocardioides rubriscoriae]
MRRRPGALSSLLLACLLLGGLGALAGCGAEESPTASDPAPTTTSDPTTSTTVPSTTATDQPTKSPPLTPGGVRFELAEMVSATAGGGAVSPEAVPLASPADVDAFTAAFSEQLAGDVRAAVEAHPPQDGQALYGAVVGFGCDTPPGVVVDAAADGGYEINGLKVADPMLECFAPVTSVAVVTING